MPVWLLPALGWSSIAGAGLWAVDQVRQAVTGPPAAATAAPQLTAAQQVELRQQQGALAADLALYQQQRPGPPPVSMGLIVTAGLTLGIGVLALTASAKPRRR
jgi:hypothetical protein